MQKNLVLFIVMSVSIYLGWMWYLGKAYPEMGKVKPHAAAVNSEPKSAVGGPTAIESSSTKPMAMVSKPKAAQSKASSVTLKNDDVEAQLSSAGAKVTSWKLLKYKEHLDHNDPVQLVPPSTDNDQFAAFEMAGTTLDSDVWSVEQSSATTVVFSASPNAGLRIRKTISLEATGSLAHVRIDYINNGRSDLKLPKSYLLWGGGIGSHDEGRQAAMSNGGAVQMEGKIQREGLGDAKVFEYSAPKWVAVKNHYFVAAWMNDGAWSEAELRRNAQGVTKTVTAALGAGEFVLKAGETKSLESRLYAGPQLYDTLKSFGNNLQAVVQFTFQWLSPLSVGQLRVMQWLNSFTHNWGVAIILLTLLVKLALFYPTHKGMVSSRRMQSKMAVMKPVLDSLKKTYKDDAAKLNQETMKLYKEHGVNPMGGCFLMLPQMFIMISLYGALNGAFELRGAAFFWVWKDLSAADPSFILVPLMGASMFLQQKMTPTNTATMSDDQAQMQKMMTYMMPIMFTVMGFLFKWPTGLLIYWSVSNAFGIAQQWYVNKTNP